MCFWEIRHYMWAHCSLLYGQWSWRIHRLIRRFFSWSQSSNSNNIVYYFPPCLKVEEMAYNNWQQRIISNKGLLDFLVNIFLMFNFLNRCLHTSKYQGEMLTCEIEEQKQHFFLLFELCHFTCRNGRFCEKKKLKSMSSIVPGF